MINVFASHPQNSKGRAFPTSLSATRSEFQRDRDRIVHSTAFRRLQHKTQVFLHHEGLHYRTRLTHTLEVSQIARSLSRALGLNEDLAEAIALAHDLGHTPFGHAGERALSECMQPFGGFDHNIQALRTVILLENRYAEHDGLNLTYETLEGMLKHNGPLTKNEASLLDFLPENLGIEPFTFASLEAQAAAIADDIAYNAHDIDDAIRAGILSLKQLRDVPLVGPIVREVQDCFPNIEAGRQTHEIQRRIITRMIENVIANSEKNIDSAQLQSVSDVHNAGKSLIWLSSAMHADMNELKAFLFANVYRAPSVAGPVQRSEKLVKRLFHHFLGAADMPRKWQEKIASVSNETERARIVSDFVAGMTDPYAISEYARLFDEKIEFS